MATKLVNGIRFDLTAEEETARQTRKTAFENSKFDRAMEEVREKRNLLLAETDHLALSDQTLSTEMTTYRQALRDITNNLTTVEEVNAVTFPTKPSEE